jgi:hypothetical protein
MRERYLSMKKIEDYQTVVLQAIKEIDPDVARKIVSRLKEMRALHESVGVGE